MPKKLSMVLQTDGNGTMEPTAEMFGAILSLCQELVKIKQTADDGIALFSCQGQAMDGYSELANYRHIVKKIAKEILKMRQAG